MGLPGDLLRGCCGFPLGSAGVMLRVASCELPKHDCCMQLGLCLEIWCPQQPMGCALISHHLYLSHRVFLSLSSHCPFVPFPGEIFSSCAGEIQWLSAASIIQTGMSWHAELSIRKTDVCAAAVVLQRASPGLAGQELAVQEGVLMGTPDPVQGCSMMGSSKGQNGQALCATTVFSHLLESLGALRVTGILGSKDFHDVSTRIRALICPMGESECMEEIWNHLGSTHTTEMGLVLTLGVVLLHPCSMLPRSRGISGLRSGSSACNYPLVPVPVGMAVDGDGCVNAESP